MSLAKSTTISTAGYTSTTCVINEDGKINVDSLVTSLTTTASYIGTSGISNVQAVQDSMSFVESMSIEELETLDKLLENKEKELQIDMPSKEETVKVYIKK